MPYIACLAIVAVAACSRSPVDAQANVTTGLPNVSLPAPSAIGEPHGPTVPARAAPAQVVKFPAALVGRWALAPRDCTAPAGAAKSLLLVTSNDLHFFESHAVPAANVETDPTSISGTFLFTGNGRSWTKYEALNVNQQRLTRTETNPSASFIYAKCS